MYLFLVAERQQQSGLQTTSFTEVQVSPASTCFFFFQSDVQYRCPMFLATSFDREVAMDSRMNQPETNMVILDIHYDKDCVAATLSKGGTRMSRVRLNSYFPTRPSKRRRRREGHGSTSRRSQTTGKRLKISRWLFGTSKESPLCLYSFIPKSWTCDPIQSFRF